MKDAGVPLQPAGTSALVQFTEKNSNRTNRNHHFHFLLIFQGTNNSVTHQSAAAETWAWIWMMNAVFTSRTGSGSVRLGPARPGSIRLCQDVLPSRLFSLLGSWISFTFKHDRQDSSAAPEGHLTPPPLWDWPAAVAMTSAGYSRSSKYEPQCVRCLPLTSPTGINI